LTFIIAEAGINHCGSLDRALKMVEVAADADADAVKFQSFTASKLGYDADVVKWLSGMELSKDDHYKLKAKAERCGIEFMSTPFSEEWVDFLVQLGVKRLKISSGKAKEPAFVDYARRTGLPLIISTGMINYAQMSAVTYPEDWVLYCVSKYPTPLNKVDFRNLSRLETLYPIWGFSDHTVGHGAAVIAVASGAKVIEKHFTMDRKLFGPDQVCSLEPDELKQMVTEIRSV